MPRGIFIAIEGGDGAGKDTQIEFLKKKLGERMVYTRVPGGTMLGEELREILIHETKGPISIPAELFLFLADRAEQVEKIIKPALEEGKIVVSNRSWLSLIAYQICGRNQPEWKSLVEDSIKKIFENVPLDLAIVLDVPPEVGLARVRSRKAALDSIENMPLEAHERVRQGFLDAAKEVKTAQVIDASRSIEEVWKDVEKAVTSVV